MENKKRWEEEFDKLCEPDWGGETFVTLDEGGDNMNPVSTEKIETERIKAFIKSTVCDALDECKIGESIDTFIAMNVNQKDWISGAKAAIDAFEQKKSEIRKRFE